MAYSDVHARALETLLLCIEACIASADACLAADAPGEECAQGVTQKIGVDSGLVRLCSSAAALAAAGVGIDETAIVEALRACALASGVCADQCERYGLDQEVEACRHCVRACNDAIAKATGASFLA